MDTRILFIFIATFSVQLVKGGYGEKTNTEESENSISTEAFIDETVTDPDDGVTIEKAILAAEITPKASYNLVDPPKPNKESQSDFYNLGDEDNQEVYPDSELQKETAFGNRLKSSSSSGGSSSSANSKAKSSNNYDSLSTSNGNSALDSDSSVFSNSLKNNRLTSTKSYSGNKQNSYYHSSFPNHKGGSHQSSSSAYQSNNLEIVKANVKEIKNNNYSPYEYVNKLNSKVKTRSSWTPYNTPYKTPQDNTAQLYKENEDKLKIEEERLYQIEAAKNYLNQIQAAQEYSAKWYQQYQNSQWRPIINTNEDSSSYLPPRKSTVVPRNQAPGVSTFGYQRNIPNPYLPQTHYQSSHNNYNSWKDSGSLPGRPQGVAFYTGPTAVPVILPSGFIADTEEVVQARIAHLKAIMEAIKAASLWKDARALKQWQY